MPSAPIGEVSQTATTADRVSLHPCLAIGRGFTGAHCQRAESEKLLSYSLFPRFLRVGNNPPYPPLKEGRKDCEGVALFPEFHRAVTSPAVPFYAGPQFHPSAKRLLRKPLAAPSFAEGAGRFQKRRAAGGSHCGNSGRGETRLLTFCVCRIIIHVKKNAK